MNRPLFSICIPAYNRARFLAPLLDSILAQDFGDFEILLCEDFSPERDQIRTIVQGYSAASPRSPIRYLENERNLGYDGNIRRLVAEARGRFCFFMGNDDLMYPHALRVAADAIAQVPGVVFVLKGYSWFQGDESNVAGTVRYVSEPKILDAGAASVAFCFRRCGVISGLIIERDISHSFASDRFDGSLYYQMFIVGSALVTGKALVLPDVLVACRDEVPPDFGNSEKERLDFVPGRYTARARLTMLKGLLAIARTIEKEGHVPVYDAVARDISAHFYPYLRDQLELPLREYWRYYRANVALGLGSTPYFHAYFVLGRLLGRRKFDWVTQKIRDILGRTVVLG